MHLGRTPDGHLESFIEMYATSVSIDVPASEDNTTYSPNDAGYVSDDHTAPLWLFMPQEAPQQLVSGEHLSGALSGLKTVERDGNGNIVSEIDVGDRISHGSARYELETKVGTPSDNDPEAYQLSFRRL